MSRLPRAFLLVTLFVAMPSAIFAQDAEDERREPIGGHWGISVWGLSYHVNRAIDYNESNLGLGLRYSARPRWRWLGHDEDNRVFVEADALRNSNKGLVLPISAGAEYQVGHLGGGCKLFAVGALTLAYYQNSRKKATELKFGPVPGFAIGCGHVKTNVLAVLSASKQTLAAIVASMTIAF